MNNLKEDIGGRMRSNVKVAFPFSLRVEGFENENENVRLVGVIDEDLKLLGNVLIISPILNMKGSIDEECQNANSRPLYDFT